MSSFFFVRKSVCSVNKSLFFSSHNIVVIFYIIKLQSIYSFKPLTYIYNINVIIVKKYDAGLVIISLKIKNIIFYICDVNIFFMPERITI